MKGTESQRRAHWRQIAVEDWLRTNRPDVWQKIVERSAEVVPYRSEKLAKAGQARSLRPPRKVLFK